MEQSRGREAAQWLAEQSHAMESALAALVEINSFTENAEGGREVGTVLASLYAMEGLALRRVPSARFADHVVIHSVRSASASKAADHGPPLALIGHLDTVFPPGVFEGYTRDGDLARGPGVLDMKGGLVVVAWALKALAQTSGFDELPELRVVVVSDEEVGSPEGQHVLTEALHDAARGNATRALVFEAGRKHDAIITRRKGTGGVTVTAFGKAAHAGNGHASGVNAIWALARFIDRAQQLTDYTRGITVNVGKISGGTSKNTVPDEAQAQVDIRFEAQADGEALVAAMRSIAHECAESVQGARIEITGGVARLPLERTPESQGLMTDYAAAARASGLGFGEAGLIAGGSDASTAHALGIAAIDGLGPRGIGFHTRDEQIEVVTLVQKAQALARFLAALRG